MKKFNSFSSYFLGIIVFFIIIGVFYFFPSPTNAQYTCDCYCLEKVDGETVGLKNIESSDALGDPNALQTCDTACQNVGVTSGGEVKNCQEKKTAVCENNDWCSAGKVCENGQCVKTGCENANDCPKDFTCINKQCTAIIIGQECKSNADCQPSQECSSEKKCINKQTTQLGCTGTTPGECPTGTECTNNQCVPKKAEGTSCKSSGDCPQGQYCQPGVPNNVCKYDACTFDSDCPSGQKCTLVPDHLYHACVAGAYCKSNSDCGTGQKCNPDLNKCESQDSAGAQTPSSQYVAAGKVDLKNPLGDIDFLNLVGKRIIPGLLGVIGAVAVVAIIWGGFSYITSRGDEKELETAKHVITYAIIGLIFALLSYILINTIVSVLGG